MQITTGTVRFMRRVQPQEYEPAEAEVSLTLAFAEDEIDVDANLSVAGDVLVAARTQVYNALNRAVPGEPVDAKVPATRHRGGKQTTKTPASGVETAALDGVGEHQQPATPAAAAPAAAPAAKPAAAAPAPVQQQSAPNVEKITVAELQKYLGGLMSSGKATSDTIKSFYPQYKIARIADLKEDQAVAFKVTIDTFLKSQEQPKPGATTNDL